MLVRSFTGTTLLFWIEFCNSRCNTLHKSLRNNQNWSAFVYNMKSYSSILQVVCCIDHVDKLVEYEYVTEYKFMYITYLLYNTRQLKHLIKYTCLCKFCIWKNLITQHLWNIIRRIMHLCIIPLSMAEKTMKWTCGESYQSFSYTNLLCIFDDQRLHNKESLQFRREKSLFINTSFLYISSRRFKYKVQHKSKKYI